MEFIKELLVNDNNPILLFIAALISIVGVGALLNFSFKKNKKIKNDKNVRSQVNNIIGNNNNIDNR